MKNNKYLHLHLLCFYIIIILYDPYIFCLKLLFAVQKKNKKYTSNTTNLDIKYINIS